ncbi:Muniscin C-terminal mu homology domain-containing protein [Phycomyces nitens]|nr:Muniscin C-terminal mu homology domain-containing protein [Phycomyces nitens]
MIQNRIRSSLKLNEELAEYFRERAHAEDLYAKSLVKLSKKLFISDKSALGHLTPIWDMLSNEVTEVSTIHAVMAFKMAEEIERPLRSSMQQDPDYATVRSMDSHFQKIARDYDERQLKMTKHKKTAEKTKKPEAEAKLAESTRAIEDIRAEWLRSGRDYVLKHQAVDEHRIYNLKTAIQSFESLQTNQLLKRVELAGHVAEAASQFKVEDEVTAFCNASPTVSYSGDLRGQSQLQPKAKFQPHSRSMSLESGHQDLPTSGSDNSLHVRSKKTFSTFISIRRKPKQENGYISTDAANSDMQEVHDNASFFSSAMNSDIPEQDTNPESANPTSPTSLSPPSVHKAQSVTGSMNGSTPLPRVVVDAEGYTIPPPDRAAWPEVASLQDDELGSDGGSVFGNQRINIEIKNEKIEQEDHGHAAEALIRVRSILKENQSTISKRPRGRRENMRSVMLSPSSDGTSDLMALKSTPEESFKSIPEEVPEKVDIAVSPFGDVQTPHLEQLPKIKVHITETIHAMLQNGAVVKSEVWGDVSIVYDGPIESATPICFKLMNASQLDQIAPNDNYVTPHQDSTDIFQINTEMFRLAGSSAVNCLKYRMRHDIQVPLVIKPMWKCDDEQTRLLVKYQKKQDQALQNIFFLTTVTGQVQTAQSIPAGQWMVEQQRMVWPMGDLDNANEQVLKAKFVTSQKGTPQSIAVRFEWHDQLVSMVNIVSGEDTHHVLWASVQDIQKTVRAGKYMAEVA